MVLVLVLVLVLVGWGGVGWGYCVAYCCFVVVAVVYCFFIAHTFCYVLFCCRCCRCLLRCVSSFQLSVCDNHIALSGARALGRALQSNYKLTTLNISNNPLKDQVRMGGWMGG